MSAKRSTVVQDLATLGVGTFRIDPDSVRCAPGLGSSGGAESIRFKTYKRTVACKKCENCRKEDCRLCSYCIDSKKHGGKGMLKKVRPQRYFEPVVAFSASFEMEGRFLRKPP